MKSINDLYNKIIKLMINEKQNNFLYVGENIKYLKQAIKNSEDDISDINIDIFKVGIKNFIYKKLKNYINKRKYQYDLIIIDDIYIKDLNKRSLKNLNKLVNLSKKGCLLISTNNPFVDKYLSWNILDFNNFYLHYERFFIGDGYKDLFLIESLKNHKCIDMTKNIIKEERVKKLNLAYLLPHEQVTGGIKILIEQMKYLKERGHYITLFIKDDNTEEEKFSWIDLDVDNIVYTKNYTDYKKYLNKYDVIILGWIGLLKDKEVNTKTVYIEQGYPALFGDIDSILKKDIYKRQLVNSYKLPHNIISVSKVLYNILKNRFNIKTNIIPNSLNIDFYKPGDYKKRNNILIVGNPYLPFKGFETIISALKSVWMMNYYFDVTWICQEKREYNNIDFNINYVILPDQENLVKCYQEADLMVYASWYEGFGMPPLEAMACGTPTIITKSDGILEYAIDGENAILVEPRNIKEIAAAIIFLLENDQIKNKLSINGRKTALNYNIRERIVELEDYLYTIYEEG